jgi:hypothetical protein
MATDMLDPAVALLRLGAVAAAGELEKVCSRREIRRALVAGTIVRRRRGLYSLPGLDVARAEATRLGGTVAGLSAAAHWNWKVVAPAPRPCVLLRRGLKRKADAYGDVDVRWAQLDADEVVDGVTSPLRTVLDCIRWLPEHEGKAVADSALRSRRVTKADLQAAVEQAPARWRDKARRVAALADARCANPFESVLHWIAAGVPGLAVEPQGDVSGIGHGDLVDRSLGLVVEAESWEFHSEKGPFAYDCRRYTAMVRAGWRVIRLVYEDVMHHPDYVRAVLADLVALGPAPRYRGYTPGIDRRIMGGI